MRKRIAGFSAVVVILSLMIQPALAQRLMVPTGPEVIQLVHSTKPAAKKAGKATPKKAKPAATGKTGSSGTAARS